MMPFQLKHLSGRSFILFIFMLTACGKASALRQFLAWSHPVSAKYCSSALSTYKGGESDVKSVDSKCEAQGTKWIKLPLQKSVIPNIDYLEEDFEVQSKVGRKFVSSPSKPSPVELISIRDHNVYFKRDDMIRLQNSNVSGNKARKMLALNQIPAPDFPECVVSYGGPQSNSMVAIAAIINSKNLELTALNEKTEETSDDSSAPYPRRQFLYFTKKIPRFLKKNPSGNFFRAKELGMEIVEISNDEYVDLFRTEQGGKQNAPVGFEELLPSNSAWIPQGGACGMATVGGEILAKEVTSFWSLNGKGRPLTVLLPGGTCSTALVVHKAIRQIQASLEQANKLDIKVVVIPCVGDEGYASRQMMAMNMETGGSGEKDEIPFVLKPTPDADFYLEDSSSMKYLRFGEPDYEILKSYREMEENGVSVDLLYGAPAWSILFRHWPKNNKEEFGSQLLSGRELLYIHSGGLEGINSQLMRYRHKGMISGKKVQHPPSKRSQDWPEFKNIDKPG